MLSFRRAVTSETVMSTCFFILLLLCVSFWGNVVYATGGNTYYVAPNGNDANAGTKAAPLKSIQDALDKTDPGDTIYVRGGTYYEDIRISRSGSAEQPIRISAYPDEQPIIDGRYNLPTGEAAKCSDVEPFHCFVYTPLVLINASHIEFSGFKIIRSRGRGIGITSPNGNSSRNISVDSCIIDGTRNAAINIQDVTQVTVTNCDVSHGADFATHARSASHLNWPVIFNIIRSDQVTVRGSRIHESWGEGIAAGRDSTNITIEDNIIYDNHALQVYLHRSQDVLLQRNLIYHTNASSFLRGGNPSECVVVNNEDNFTDSLLTERLKITNNVMVGCGRGIAVWGNAGSDLLTRDVEISNNTVVNSVKNTSAIPVGIFVNPRVALRNVLIENNIVLQDVGDSGSIPENGQISLSNNLWSTTPSDGGRSSSDYIGNPQLRNPYNELTPGAVQINWYKPQSDSIANQLGVGPYEYLDESVVDTPAPAPTAAPTAEPTEVPVATPAPTSTGTVPVPPSNDTGTSVDLSNPQLLYQFDENGGSVVGDSALYDDKVNLVIEDESAIRWSGEGLTVIESTLIRSTSQASKLIENCRTSDELSLSLWITPANTTQDGPARIISLSGDTLSRNFMIGQGLWGSHPSDLFTARIRTNQTNNNGEPDLIAPSGTASDRKTHLAYVRSKSGSVEMYVNGASVASGTVDGTFSNWDRGYALILGNEATGDRPWLGTFHQIAIYCGALTENDVEDLYGLTADLPGSSPADPSEPTDPGVSDPLDFFFETFIPYVIP